MRKISAEIPARVLEVGQISEVGLAIGLEVMGNEGEPVVFRIPANILDVKAAALSLYDGIKIKIEFEVREVPEERK